MVLVGSGAEEVGVTAATPGMTIPDDLVDVTTSAALSEKAKLQRHFGASLQLTKGGQLPNLPRQRVPKLGLTSHDSEGAILFPRPPRLVGHEIPFNAWQAAVNVCQHIVAVFLAR